MLDPGSKLFDIRLEGTDVFLEGTNVSLEGTEVSLQFINLGGKVGKVISVQARRRAKRASMWAVDLGGAGEATVGGDGGHSRRLKEVHFRAKHSLKHAECFDEVCGSGGKKL